jgi:hypothetical protein
VTCGRSVDFSGFTGLYDSLSVTCHTFCMSLINYHITQSTRRKLSTCNRSLTNYHINQWTLKNLPTCHRSLINYQFCCISTCFKSSLKVHKKEDNFSGIRVTRSLVLCVCFIDRCLSFCTLSFDHCVVCSSSIYVFWLHLWYLQTTLKTSRNTTKLIVNVQRFRISWVAWFRTFIWYTKAFFNILLMVNAEGTQTNM